MQSRTRILTAISVVSSIALAPGAAADGPFLGVKLNRTAIELDTLPQPGLIDTERTRPAVLAGYSFGGFEIALEYWRADTGPATCPPAVACPAVFIPTEVELTTFTLGYEWPVSSEWSVAVRGGIETARADYAGSPFEDDTAAFGATARYHLSERATIGLDFSGSGFETRSVGLEVRWRF